MRLRYYDTKLKNKRRTTTAMATGEGVVERVHEKCTGQQSHEHFNSLASDFELRYITLLGMAFAVVVFVSVVE